MAMAMAAVVPSASNTYSNSFIFAVPVFILEAASFLIGYLLVNDVIKQCRKNDFICSSVSS